MLFLGISLESHRTRSVVFSLETNNIVGESSVEHAAETGTVLLDPSAWVRSVNESVRSCLDKLGEQGRRLAGISVVSPPQGFVFLDAKNRLVVPNRRMEEQAVESSVKGFAKRFGGRPGLLELLGCEIKANSVAACLLWLKENDPEVFSCIASVLQPHEFINFWLTGNRCGDAAGGSMSGFMDVRRREWNEVVMSALDEKVPSLVSTLHSSKEVVGGLRPEIAREWGVVDHLLVAAGGSRIAMDAMGTGTINPEEVIVDFSNKGRLSAVLDHPTIDPLGTLSLSCDAADQWILSCESKMAGKFIEEVKAAWSWDNGQFEQIASAGNVGAGGLIYRNGKLEGVHGENLSPANMARAAMEAAIFEKHNALSHLKALGVTPARVKLYSDSGAQSGWRQVFADALGMPVASVSEYASPAVGAALQAAVVYYQATGENITFTEVAEYSLPIKDEDWSYPDLEKKEAYDKLAGSRNEVENGWSTGVSA